MSASNPRAGVECVRISTAYEATAELLAAPAAVLVIDLRTIHRRHLRLLRIARQLNVEMLAMGTLPSGLAADDLSGVRLLARADLPAVLETLGVTVQAVAASPGAARAGLAQPGKSPATRQAPSKAAILIPMAPPPVPAATEDGWDALDQAVAGTQGQYQSDHQAIPIPAAPAAGNSRSSKPSPSAPAEPGEQAEAAEPPAKPAEAGKSAPSAGGSAAKSPAKEAADRPAQTIREILSTEELTALLGEGP